MSTNAQIHPHGKIVEEYIVHYSAATEALRQIVRSATLNGFEGGILIDEKDIVFSWQIRPQLISNAKFAPVRCVSWSR